ncbi:MAG: hypothetical protein HQM14_12970 [SAR324 cluster bacterium]|nr:hypothetical protein [SAR324 cluster bacterium]
MMDVTYLTPLDDVTGLTVECTPYDLHKDLHVFINYIKERSVKRSYRSNELSTADSKRLAKLMGNPSVLKEIEEDYFYSWIDFVDSFALDLQWIEYNTKGEYMGYSSSAPSFPDNYIKFQNKTYDSFLSLSINEQEQTLLNTLCKTSSDSDNEFFRESQLGRLDSFDRWGCGTGVIPYLNFSKARRFLLECLTLGCQKEVWYSTASLIQFLKKQHPFFLIPQKPKMKHGKEERYCNFREYQGGNRYSGQKKQITAKDADAFERVEGRFVERFLERIPFLMGYADLAYDESVHQDIPSLGKLKAFRLHASFFQTMKGEAKSPKVTVQPNFEVCVESSFYPVTILSALTPFTTIVSDDTAIVLKLDKAKITEALAQNEELDVIALLQQLSNQNLPQNVMTELEEWKGHSEVFTLYEGYALYEGDVKLSSLKEFTVESIDSKINLIHSPQKLFNKLEQAELMPVMLKHQRMQFCSLPSAAKTIFSKTTPQTKKTRQSITLKREVFTILYFPSEKLLQIFRKALLKVHCPIEVDPVGNSLRYPQKFEKEIKQIIQQLKQEYQIKIKDIE